ANPEDVRQRSQRDKRNGVENHRWTPLHPVDHREQSRRENAAADVFLLGYLPRQKTRRYLQRFGRRRRQTGPAVRIQRENTPIGEEIACPMRVLVTGGAGYI